MKKGTIQFEDGNYISVCADYIERGEDFVTLWNGEFVVAYAKVEKITCAYLTETSNKKE